MIGILCISPGKAEEERGDPKQPDSEAALDVHSARVLPVQQRRRAVACAETERRHPQGRRVPPAQP